MSPDRRGSPTAPPAGPDEAPSRREHRLLVVLGLLSALFVIPALGVQYWIYTREQQETLDTELRRTQTRGRTIAALVDQQMEASVRTMRGITSRPLLLQAWERRDLAPLDIHLAEARALAPEFLFVGVFDLQGTLHRSVPADPTVGSNFAYRDWFRGVMATQRPYVSEVYRTRVSPRSLVVAVAAPLHDSAGKMNGILMGAIPIDTIGRRVADTQRSVQGEPIVVDQHGLIVAPPSHAQGTEPVPAPNRALVDVGLAGREAVRSMGSGREGYIDSVTPIPSLGWTVLYRRTNEMAYGALYRLRQRLISANAYLGLVFLATASVAFHLVKRQDALTRDVRESEARYRMLFDSSPLPLWLFDVESRRFLAVNRAAVRHYGYSREEFMSMSVADIRPPEDVPRFLERLREAGAGFGNGEGWRHRKKDGQVVDVEIFSHRLEVGGRQASLVMVNDVSELKRHREELQTLLDSLQQRSRELEALNHELEAFTYSVSHDLRAPLRAVAGFARILEEDHSARLDAEGTSYLHRIVEGARQMGVLIDDLLNLSRIGRTQLERIPIRLGEIVEEARQKVSPDAGARHVDWQIDPLPEVHCDPRLIRQVFVNLLSNAMKYTRRHPHARIVVGAQVVDGGPVFFVRDNGVGFDMKYVHKLFGVFQRLHDSADFEGTGVGLATAQRIVQRHGGRIWAEAEVDRGATFYFTLAAAGAAD